MRKLAALGHLVLFLTGPGWMFLTGWCEVWCGVVVGGSEVVVVRLGFWSRSVLWLVQLKAHYCGRNLLQDM